MAESNRNFSLAIVAPESERKTEAAVNFAETGYTKEVIHYSSNCD